MSNLLSGPNPLSLLQAQSRYGEIRNGVWGGESKWCRTFQLPPELQFKSWINTLTGEPVTRFYCNVDMVTPLLAALTNIKHAGLEGDLHTFDGLFNIRDVRAEPGKVSAHAYALAIDINASEQPLGKPSTLSDDFVRCWTKAGFFWGGKFKRIDGMHLTLGW